MQKVLAIKAGQDYDTRVQIQVDFTDKELFKYMKAAHECDMTFNEFVVQAITEAIRLHEADPERFSQLYND
jgi:hypothetical protein